MAHSNLKLELDFTEFIDLLERIEEVGGNLDEVAEEALSRAFDVITPKIEKAIQNSNLPAHGKYSQKYTRKALITDKKIIKEGSTFSVNAGFDFRKGGMTSIYLMYGTEVNGTPRMAPAKGLKEAIQNIYSDEIQAIQRDVLQKAINKAVLGHE